MPTYRRAFIPGGTFFFTLVTHRRRRFLCDATARNCLRNALRMCGDRWSFTIEATVLLPDHLHTIWTLPDEDADFSRRWAFVKKEFTKAWLASGGCEGPTTNSDRATRRRGVWQRRFWEHAIQTERDFLCHCDYIHYNPVRHDLVRCPHEWPYSTFPRWVARGAYARDWLCSCNKRTVTPLDLPGIEATTGE